MNIDRPLPDGKTAFLPIEVGVDSFGWGVNPHTLHFYCGKCRRLMGWGEAYRLFERCPRCGVLIGDWWPTGMTKRAVREEKGRWIKLPDFWPVTLDGFDCISDTEAGSGLLLATVNGRACLGSGSENIETP